MSLIADKEICDKSPMKIKLKNLKLNSWHSWISNVSPFALLWGRDGSKIYSEYRGQSLSLTPNILSIQPSHIDTYHIHWQGIHSPVSPSSPTNFSEVLVTVELRNDDHKKKSHFLLLRNVSAAGFSKGLGQFSSLLYLSHPCLLDSHVLGRVEKKSRLPQWKMESTVQ